MVARFHGVGSWRWRCKATAAVSAASGIVAASVGNHYSVLNGSQRVHCVPSNDVVEGMWNVVQSHAMAYSANDPPGVPIS